MYTAVARGTLHFALQLLYIYNEGPFGFPMCYRESKSGNGKCLYIYIEGWVFVPNVQICKCRQNGTHICTFAARKKDMWTFLVVWAVKSKTLCVLERKPDQIRAMYSGSTVL